MHLLISPYIFARLEFMFTRFVGNVPYLKKFLGDSPIKFENLEPNMEYEVRISTRLHGRSVGHVDLLGKTGKEFK